ncbi:MAG: hypothetical protein WC881_01770 [Elusimicrobiota bacterium]|jgi:hypothetical protein
MKAQELKEALEEFQSKLSEHAKLWGKSLSPPLPDYPTANQTDLRQYPKGRDSCMLPTACFRTSMGIKGGASGGPVFDYRGYVFAINSSGVDGTSISFVSSIFSVFPVWISDVRIPRQAPSVSRVRIDQLREWGFVKCLD